MYNDVKDWQEPSNSKLTIDSVSEEIKYENSVHADQTQFKSRESSSKIASRKTSKFHFDTGKGDGAPSGATPGDLVGEPAWIAWGDGCDSSTGNSLGMITSRLFPRTQITYNVNGHQNKQARPNLE